MSEPSFEEAVVALRHAVWSDGKDARAFVAGQDPSGLLIVRIETKNAEFTLKVPDISMLQALIGPQLAPPRDAIPLPYKPRTFASPTVTQHPVVESNVVLLAGAKAQHNDAVESMHLQRLTVAGYTCRGPSMAAQGLEYKSYNEDSLVLRARVVSGTRQAVAIGAFDQAGGEGSKDGEPGSGSEAAAKAFAAAIHEIEEGHDPEDVLRDAATIGDAAVRRLGVGAVTTMAVAIVVADNDAITAYVLNCGDSRVIHAAADGTMLHSTVLHNMGFRVSRGEHVEIPRALALHFAAGLTRGLGAEDVTPDYYEWKLKPGDRLIVATDGLGDCHELEEMPIGEWHAEHCADQIARIAASATDETEAVVSLAGYALDQASDRRGKPDNLAVGVIFVK